MASHAAYSDELEEFANTNEAERPLSLARKVKKLRQKYGEGKDVHKRRQQFKAIPGFDPAAMRSDKSSVFTQFRDRQKLAESTKLAAEAAAQLRDKQKLAESTKLAAEAAQSSQAAARAAKLQAANPWLEGAFGPKKAHAVQTEELEKTKREEEKAQRKEEEKRKEEETDRKKRDEERRTRINKEMADNIAQKQLERAEELQRQTELKLRDIDRKALEKAQELERQTGLKLREEPTSGSSLADNTVQAMLKNTQALQSSAEAVLKLQGETSSIISKLTQGSRDDEEAKLAITQANLKEAYASIVKAPGIVSRKVGYFAPVAKSKPVYAFLPWKTPYTSSIISELKSRLGKTFAWNPSLEPIPTIDITKFCKIATDTSKLSTERPPIYVSLLHNDGSFTDTGAITFPSSSSVSFYRNTYADLDNRNRMFMAPHEDSSDFTFFYDTALLVMRDIKNIRVEEVELKNGPILQFIVDTFQNIVTVETYHPFGKEKEVHITISLSTTGNALGKKRKEQNVFTQNELLPMLREITNSNVQGLSALTLNSYEFLKQVQNRVVTMVTVGTPTWDLSQNITAVAISQLTAVTCDNIRYHGATSLDAMITRQAGTIKKLEYSERDSRNEYIAAACRFAPVPAGILSALSAGDTEITEEAAKAFDDKLKTAEMKLNELDAILITLENRARGAAEASAIKVYVRQLPHVEGSEVPPKSEEEKAKDQLAQNIEPSCDTTPQEFAANLAVAMDTVRFESRTAVKIAKEKELADAFNKIVTLFNISDDTLATALNKLPYKHFIGPLAWEKYIKDFKEKKCKKTTDDGDVEWDEFNEVYKFEELLTIVKNIKMYVKKLPHEQDSIIPEQKQWEKNESLGKKPTTLPTLCQVSPEEFAATLAIAMDSTWYNTRTANDIRKETALANAFDQIVQLFNISDETLVTVLDRFPYSKFAGPIAWKKYIDDFIKLSCSDADVRYKFSDLTAILESLKVELAKRS